ncbi:type 1 glutamine amidotransferase [Litoreibacter arenae]|uniref:GMP synthase n=1 Tax=Litoreibacter arenae DSM 19593 TaxID=1123360 RepID=S9QJR1_9RHOB|nr:type 1 glutamine amidotransferase [Litoreibacter arenae]EPX80022.1 GMP synthase [Litoreibacter arenae DSM 19593]
MKIGILTCGHAAAEVLDEHGDYPEMFHTLLDGHGFTFKDYDVEHLQFPANIRDCDGWLLTGSRHGVYEDHAFIPLLETFIREVYAAHIPMVGICFGHQIIAQALGGHVEKFNGGWSIGATDYQFDDLGRVTLNAWHQDQVITPPEGAMPVASNDFCANAALVYDDRIYTVQPHPEFSNSLIAEYVRLRAGGSGYPDDVMARAAERVTCPTDSQMIADKIADFFKQPREASRAS